ncbi:MAG TPA: GAF domain-containing sensor histidine kinase [Pseudomonas xinjiangensis]|uniref:histidine kinase n=2 Tax=root TaxID=1 RepID=A0A7V1BRZ7_9GAMM|nr:GAF domain-containing sensor histidine kinase [Halopseudomonas xinjiangensis]HEC46996.1 GAF domain-containing sensor histidine kinase [Halopseudomonas xinjiangensis]
MSLENHQEIDAFDSINAVPSILQVICRSTGMGFAAVARVTEDRWIACRTLDLIDFGLQPGSELQVESTICHEVRQSREPVVIDHVAEDVFYSQHHTPRLYGFQSYISMPIILPDGTFYGTLCAIDPKPAKVKNLEVVGMFELFAELIAIHLDTQSRLAQSEANLSGERDSAKLREEFIAVLGHDLRNPLASIKAGTGSILRAAHTDEKTNRIARLMQNSVGRMEGLINNLLDFARGRLGGGLALDRETKSMEPTFIQVLDEFRASAPDRLFDIQLSLDQPVEGDHSKIAQLISNLIGNAVMHGAAQELIHITALTTDTSFELAVANGGKPISDEVREQLFQPFYRGHQRASLQGLGLGLYISSEIAKAHDGSLEVSSTAEQTRFVFRMPRVDGSKAGN